jgi:H+/Cl- antiporter ClcA
MSGLVYSLAMGSLFGFAASLLLVLFTKGHPKAVYLAIGCLALFAACLPFVGPSIVALFLQHILH